MSEPNIPCGVCGGQACAGSGDYAVCSEFCDMVAKQYTIKDARIATLEALIADAPHSKDCPRSSKHSSFLSCNCFKSRALDTKEKSND